MYPVADQDNANEPCGEPRRLDLARLRRWRCRSTAAGVRIRRSTTAQGRDLRHGPLLADGADAAWAWKSFLRGHNPILYDLGIFAGFDPLDPTLEPARLALGDTRRLAERIDLARTEPQGHLASSGFALVRPDHEYVALRPRTTAAPSRSSCRRGPTPCGGSTSTTASSSPVRTS